MLALKSQLLTGLCSPDQLAAPDLCMIILGPSMGRMMESAGGALCHQLLPVDTIRFCFCESTDRVCTRNAQTVLEASSFRGKKGSISIAIALHPGEYADVCTAIKENSGG